MYSPVSGSMEPICLAGVPAMTLQCGSVSQAKSPTARTEGLSAFLQEGRRCNLANLRQSIRKKPWAGCGGMPFRHFGKDEAEVLDLHCVDPLTFQMNDPANWKSSNPFFHRAQSMDERIGTQQILASCRGRSYGTGLAAPEDRTQPIGMGGCSRRRRPAAPSEPP